MLIWQIFSLNFNSLLLFLFFYFLFDWVCGLSWSGTHYVDQGGLSLQRSASLCHPCSGTRGVYNHTRQFLSLKTKQNQTKPWISFISLFQVHGMLCPQRSGATFMSSFSPSTVWVLVIRQTGDAFTYITPDLCTWLILIIEDRQRGNKSLFCFFLSASREQIY